MALTNLFLNNMLLALEKHLAVLLLMGSCYAEDDTEAKPLAINQCNDVHLQKCMVDFNQKLNILGDADWHQPNLLVGQIEGILKNNGTTGVINLCRAWLLFYQCLGSSAQYCFNPLVFLSHGYNFANSYWYVGIINQLHFICAGGMQSLTYNPCIQNTMKNQQIPLTSCFENYWTAVRSNQNPGCSPAQTLLHCYSQPFLSGCGSPGSWWGCEYQRVSVATRFYNCGLACQVGPNLNGKIAKSEKNSEQGPIKIQQDMAEVVDSEGDVWGNKMRN